MPICFEIICSFRLPSASGANLLSRCQFRALCASTRRTKGFDMNGWIWHYQIMFQNTIIMCKDLYLIVWDKSHCSRICILDNRLYQIALILPLCIWNIDGLCYIDKSATYDIIDVEAPCSVQSFFQQVMFRLTSFGRDSWILQKDSEVTLPRSCSPGTGLQVIYIPCETSCWINVLDFILRIHVCEKYSMVTRFISIDGSCNQTRKQRKMMKQWNIQYLKC